jgi:hypothetical protein
MKKNSLTPNKGLSLSQAQSISNLCNQRANEIEAKLRGVNNYGKTVDVTDGNKNTKTHTLLAAKPLPTNVAALLLEQAMLHACQGFLMENMKAKDAMLQLWKKRTADFSGLEMPERPENVKVSVYPQVTEEFGWEQLTKGEVAEFIEAEAFAAHIGQFIHKDGTLAHLRRELPSIPAIEWMNIYDGVKSPVSIVVHDTHTSEKLLQIHEELAAEHRKYEQRVNYFKAKVKNLTTEENARIAKVNADAQNTAEKQNKDAQEVFTTLYRKATERVKSINAEFEKERQAKIKEIASLRIGIDARFQKVIDTFLATITPVQE